jgi:hypothetical protein
MLSIHQPRTIPSSANLDDLHQSSVARVLKCVHPFYHGPKDCKYFFSLSTNPNENAKIDTTLGKNKLELRFSNYN